MRWRDGKEDPDADEADKNFQRQVDRLRKLKHALTQ